jgi:hypothetical protein
MALGLWNLAKYLVSPFYFTMIWDIDLIFGMRVYNDELQIRFTFCSGPIIFDRVMALRLWNLVKYLVVTTFFAMLGDMDLIFGIWVYNDELQIRFTFCSGPIIFDRVMALGLWNLSKYLVSPFYFTMIWDIDLIFGMRVYNHKLQINFEIHFGWIIFGQPTAVGLWNLAKYLVFTTFLLLWFEILTWFLVCECIVKSYRSS